MDKKDKLAQILAIILTTLIFLILGVGSFIGAYFLFSAGKSFLKVLGVICFILGVFFIYADWMHLKDVMALDTSELKAPLIKIFKVVCMIGGACLLYLALFRDAFWLVIFAIPLMEFALYGLLPKPGLTVAAIGGVFGVLCIGVAFFEKSFDWDMFVLGLALFVSPMALAAWNNGHPVDKKEKEASVVGRAVAGGIIAGGAGAVVGALSAIDENNRKRSEQDKK